MRARLEPGSWGKYTEFREADGRHVAKARFRDQQRRSGVMKASSSKSAAEARRRLTDKLSAISDPRTISTKQVTIGLLCNRYLIEALEPDQHLSPRSKRIYRSRTEAIKKQVGFALIAEFTTGRAEAFLNTNPLTGDARTAAERSALRTQLSIIFGYALRNDLILRNPISGVSNTRHEHRTVESFTDEELEQVLQAVEKFEISNRYGPSRGTRLSDACHVLAATGLRIGELLGLRACDVILDGGVRVAVTGQIVVEEVEGVQKNVRVDMLKTQNSRRTLPVDPKSRAGRILLARKIAARSDDALLWETAQQTPWPPHNLRTALRKAVLALPEPLRIKVKPHTFRKTVATRLERAFGLEYAGKALRHGDDTRVTSQHYVARLEQIDDRFMDVGGL